MTHHVAPEGSEQSVPIIDFIGPPIIRNNRGWTSGIDLRNEKSSDDRHDVQTCTQVTSHRQIKYRVAFSPFTAPLADMETSHDTAGSNLTGASGEPAPLMDVGALASQLGVTERFVRRLVEENRVSYHKIGKFIRFHPDDISDWIADTRVENRPSV